MKIKDVMVVGAVTIGVGSSVAEAAALMREQDVGMLVVGEESLVEGVVTDRDLLIRCVGEGHMPDSCPVSDHATVPVITIDPEADALDAAHILREKRIKRMPVIEGGVLMGVVSFTDISQAVGQPLHDLLFGSGTVRHVPTSMRIGTITHYYNKIGVGALDLEAPVHLGDTVHIIGRATSVKQQVESLEIDHKRVDTAYRGDDAALRVAGRVRPGDVVYREVA